MAELKKKAGNPNWVKGVSGNPGGWTSEERRLRDVLRVKALKRALRILNKEEVIEVETADGRKELVPAERVDENAIDAIKIVSKWEGMDKPTQHEVTVTDLTDADREARLLALLAKAKKG